jgi:hypothetical protein
MAEMEEEEEEEEKKESHGAPLTPLGPEETTSALHLEVTSDFEDWNMYNNRENSAFQAFSVSRPPPQL